MSGGVRYRSAGAVTERYILTHRPTETDRVRERWGEGRREREEESGPGVGLAGSTQEKKVKAAGLGQTDLRERALCYLKAEGAGGKRQQLACRSLKIWFIG